MTPALAWAPPDERPREPGVYEVNLNDGGQWYRRYDGQNWRCGMNTPEKAADSFRPVFSGTPAPWRPVVKGA